MRLKELQEEFARSVVNQGTDTKLTFRAEGKLSSHEAMEVYRRDYEARMLEALGSNYEATWLLLGDEDFFSLGKKYIFSHASSLKSLITYGHLFPEFLSEENQGEAAVSMAVFERIFWQLFHAEDNHEMTFTQEDILSSRFELKNIFLINSPFRIDEIWNHRQLNTDVLSEMNLEEEAFIALFKAGEKVQFTLLTQRGFKFLEELKQRGWISECGTLPRPEEWNEIFSVLKWAELGRVGREDL